MFRMEILFIIWDKNPTLFEFGGFQLRYYTLFWGIGILLSLIVLQYFYKKEKISEELLSSLFIYVMIGIVVGARLGHCLFYNPSYYFLHPFEMILPISKDMYGNYHLTGYAGLASHGGTLGLVAALILYSRKKKQNIWNILDQLALLAPLTGAFIRVGNFFNSEILGKPSTMPWAVVFEKIDALPRHPAQLYEAFFYFALFFVLLYFFIQTRKQQNYGFIFGMSLAAIFSIRFFVEFYKEVQEPFELVLKEHIFLNMGQLLSIPFVIAGLVIIWIRRKSQSRKVPI